MTTFTVQVKDSDAEVLLAVLKKFRAKLLNYQGKVGLPKNSDSFKTSEANSIRRTQLI